MLCWLLLTAWGCGDKAPPEKRDVRIAEGTPVILISIDTLRSDRLPAYGYSLGETPAIDALRRDSTLFERAYTHIPLTLPSHASILSGRTPLELGLRDNVGYRFDSDEPSLPSLLQSKGYETGAFVSSWVLRADTGIARGFGHFDDNIGFESGKQLGTLQRPGMETLNLAMDWLETVQSEPFFLFFHIYEPHAPYDPPEPYASRFESAYDGEVAEADAVIGKLIDKLESLDLYDRAIIVLLSDHGEGLMDHGEMDHLIFVYREVLQVPLLLKLPRGRFANTTVEASAQLTDVAPTVYRLLGMEPPEGLGGRPLLDLRDEGTNPARRIYSESIYPRIHFGWSDLASMIEGDYHYIDAPHPELYHLAQDPGEKNNILRDHPQIVSELRAELRGFDRTISTPLEEDPDVRSQLAALGYVSGGIAEVDGPLKDPKDRIHVIDDLGRASQHSREGRYQEAIAAYRSVLAEEPQMALAWQQLGSALHDDGNRREALEAYLQAYELSPDGGIAASVADLNFELGNMDDARAYAQLAIVTEPIANNILAKVAMREDDLEAAKGYLDKALESRGQRLAPLITQSALLNKLGQHEEALAVTSLAEAEFGTRTDRHVLQNLYLHRGMSYGYLGRFEEAKAAYIEAIAVGPENLPAYSALSFVLALENRATEAGKVLTQMIERNPTPAAYLEAAKALRAMKDPDSAAAILARARRLWPDDERLKQM